METKMSMNFKSSQGMDAQFVTLENNNSGPKLVQSGFVESTPEEEEYDFSSGDFEQKVADIQKSTMMAESQAKLTSTMHNQPMMSRTGLKGGDTDKRGQRSTTVKTTGKVGMGENVLFKGKSQSQMQDESQMKAAPARDEE